MNKKVGITGLLFVSLVFILSSCSIESKIAKPYLEAKNKGSVLLFIPDHIYKTNLNTWLIDDSLEYSEYEKDSILIEDSFFIKDISDSLLLTNYISNFIKTLRTLGFNIYTEQYIGEFMQDTGLAFIVNIAQIEIEEYLMDVKDEEYIDEQLYYVNHSLNALNINSWFEISRLNDEKMEKELLFVSHFTSDDLYSSFTQYIFSGDINYDFNIDSISVEDVYDLATYLGGLYAEYTFDYILNDYIVRNLPAGITSRYYFHYDKTYKRLVAAGEERFVLMEP